MKNRLLHVASSFAMTAALLMGAGGVAAFPSYAVIDNRSVPKPQVSAPVRHAAPSVVPREDGRVRGATRQDEELSSETIPASGPVLSPPAPPGREPIIRKEPVVIGFPAPSSFATGSVLRLEPLSTCISCTTAGAARGRSGGDATALRVLGHDLSGGRPIRKRGERGALVALPANSLAGLAVADWTDTARVHGMESSAWSRAALVDLSLAGGELATVAVVESASNTTSRGSVSHGDSATNGVDLDVLRGMFVVIVLHSESSSDRSGRAYVASLDGRELLGQEQLGTAIPIEIPGVLPVPSMGDRDRGRRFGGSGERQRRVGHIRRSGWRADHYGVHRAGPRGMSRSGIGFAHAALIRFGGVDGGCAGRCPRAARGPHRPG